MDNYLFSMAVALILSTIKAAVKSPAKKRALKAALLKVRDAINALYPEEVIGVAKVRVKAAGKGAK